MNLTRPMLVAFVAISVAGVLTARAWGTPAGLAVAVAGAVLAVAVSGAVLKRKELTVAGAVRRYRAGDFSHPAADYGGDPLGMAVHVLDDTARTLGHRLAELGRDRARVETLVQGLVTGVLEIDASGTVRLANAAICKMLRIEHPIGRPYLESIRHPDVANQLTTALRGESTDWLEFSLNRQPGRTFAARATPIVSTDATGAVLVVDDITELRMADRVRRDFVANVSHELRTPLTAIRGYVEALGDEPLEPADRKRFLEIITRHTDRMERLVKDLLRLAGLEAGQEPVETALCQIETLFSHVVSELTGPIASTRHRISTRVDPAVATLRTDAAKLHDALRNLVENAILYSEPGTAIELSAAEQNGELVLQVADEGPGIPAAHLSRVFERFYRVDKARSRESGGTGLGLTIVKHLVERLGGRVVAANRPSGGAIFTIALPGHAVAKTSEAQA
jgi:two-component system phosphate regulon sensor histidine kinase PhoR